MSALRTWSYSRWRWIGCKTARCWRNAEEASPHQFSWSDTPWPDLILVAGRHVHWWKLRPNDVYNLESWSDYGVDSTEWDVNWTLWRRNNLRFVLPVWFLNFNSRWLFVDGKTDSFWIYIISDTRYPLILFPYAPKMEDYVPIICSIAKLESIRLPEGNLWSMPEGWCGSVEKSTNLALQNFLLEILLWDFGIDACAVVARIFVIGKLTWFFDEICLRIEKETSAMRKDN